MSLLIAERRYLINFDVSRVGHVFTDVLVVGGGVAGLRAAIEAARSGQVIVTTKDDLAESTTAYAQGGVAAVLDAADSIDHHVTDTLAVGNGLCDPGVVERLAREGPDRVREMIDWGARFDMHDGRVALGLEGAHSAPRIVHAQGDATGREIVSTLARRAAATESIRAFEQCFVIDLITLDNRCVGALTFHPKYGHQAIWARQTILACGGCGTLYRETTNPPSATGDGPALALRAGAVLRDMEFIQFHPTTLYVAGATRALISEAVRGEGAYLVDRLGARFMQEYYPDAELAPRDVVSRAMVDFIKRSHATTVFLDVRHFPPGRFAARFPTIAALCAQFDLDPEKDLIPVRPAAHYTIGGVRTDERGRTNVAGLLACGECASSGAHGANRLASNSLLEGLVLGRIVGAYAGEATQEIHRTSQPPAMKHHFAPSPRTTLDLGDIRNSLRSLCWRNLGIERSAPRLEETIEITDFWSRYVMDKVFDERFGWETQNMLTVARCIALSALTRKESRGVHYRSDYPTADPERFLGHVELVRGGDGLTTRLSPLERHDR
ncbi:MAG: L-aspartate oxidase [Phycisphaerae bacterium]|nr:L-aspartate oxidase [Phycisphaerae bacterium]